MMEMNLNEKPISYKSQSYLYTQKAEITVQGGKTI